MNQFDKNIKDKISAKQYPYKAQYWKAFKKHSGMSVWSTGMKVAVFSVMGAAILGTALFFALRPNGNEAVSTPPIPEVQVEEIVADSTCIIENPVVESPKVKDEQTSISNGLSANKTSEEKDVLIEVPAFSEEPVTQPLTKGKNKAKPVNYGRPLHILVDTISSNDFPDYKAKPADEIF